MIDNNEIHQAMRGSWALALGDPGGLRYFENSFDAFWRSFQVILYVVPVYLLMMSFGSIAENGVAQTVFARPFFYVAQTFLIIVEWITFPVLMILLARLLNVTSRYGLFITVSNWNSLLIVAVLFPVNLALNIIGVGDGASFFFSLAVMVLVMRYRWFVTKTVLDVSSMTAAGLVIIEFLISFMFTGISLRLLGSGTG
ncbi:MAG: hypothetical protein K8F25_09195 [Fimbriimonadaceae bacterium]|nr:hypothetical protein [Alphaproteobacteria bacterium]